MSTVSGARPSASALGTSSSMRLFFPETTQSAISLSNCSDM